MTYCVSDIHGCYDEFMQLLDEIKFGPDDTLYVLGDAIDRGKDSFACLRFIMETPNIHMLMGNHEQMMMDALIYIGGQDSLEHWFLNGGESTCLQFLSLGEDEKVEVIEFLAALPYLIEVKIADQNYVLVHAGINVARVPITMLSTAAVLPKQSQDDLIWIREKFLRRKALPKSIIIFGHTPTFSIDRKHKGKVWRDGKHKDKTGIDGGCVYGGHLLVLRLDVMAEYSVAQTKQGSS